LRGEADDSSSPLGGRLIQGKLGDQTINLGLEKFQGAFVPENEIGPVDFPRQRQLLRNPLCGERAIQSTLLQPNELLVQSTGATDGEIKPNFQSALK
jgi:hypothetical protein